MTGIFGVDPMLQWLRYSKVPEALKRVFEDYFERRSRLSSPPNRQAIGELVTSIEGAARSASFDLIAMEPTLRSFVSDCYVVLGRFQDALELFVRPEIGTRASTQTDRLLSLKLLAGDQLTGRDVLTLIGPKLTQLGKESIDQVENRLNQLLDDLCAKSGKGILELWAIDARPYPYQVFVGSPDGYEVSRMIDLPGYAFSLSETVDAFVRAITREAENLVRQGKNLPAVGEGWVSETMLYYEIKAAFANEEVLQHASPKWLGRQHLDVFLPSRNVAVEYQGLQHDRAIEHFGGEEAYKKTVLRDRKKQRLCEKNGVRLIYARPGYEIDSLLNQIRIKQ